MASWADGESYDVLMGRWSRILAPRFVAWGRLPAQGEVLDVGCGTGALSQAVADAGAKRVQGIDRSQGYADHAAALLGAAYPQVSFEAGDAMDLRFADRTFDASVSGLVLNFVPDPSVVVQEMRRVVRPGGVVAAYVWDYAEGMDLLRRFWDAAIALDPEASSLDEGNRFPICDPEALDRVFQGAGLEGVETGHIDQPIAFRDFDDYWEPFLGGQGPSGGYAMGLSEEDRARFREALRASLPEEVDGSIPMTLRAWTARGTSP
ncbi:MAG: class I SAM-dependent methyltransferase [Thermoplasmata archaeon]